MNVPVHPRARGARAWTLVVLGALVAALLAAATPARAQVEDMEPGVTLRTYDLGVGLQEICTLRAGQTPNVDKLMPVIDFKTEADFGLADNFLSHTIATLTAPSDGEYAFRLTSDDGSRLLIDDEVVVDHDGLHGIDPPAVGTTTLSAGAHDLFIEHFEAGGGQQVTLEWQPPGAADFELVPNSALSTPSGVVRVTAPGTKYCEGATDSPGDGAPLNGVHPDYDLIDLRPEGFEPAVSALAWTEDDRLVVATSGDVSPGGPVPDPESGEVYILDGVVGDTSADEVTVTKVAEDLLNPMGAVVVDGTIYVSERDGLTALTPDSDGDGLLEQEQIAEWPYGGNFHEFAFGLEYADGYFYVSLSVAIDPGGKTTNPQPAANRGTSIRVDRETGDIDFVASGLRTPNGMGFGPGGELFVMDNQGDWLPSSKLIHIEQDAFFNSRPNPPGPFDDQPVTRPVLWLPQNEIGNSPSNPELLSDGPFAGQMLFGDVTYGGLQRAYLEEVDGAYQGAVFRHSAGLEAGVNRTIVGPDGDIYVGGIGEGGNWGEPGKLRYGLQKLSPNGTNAFDIREMRATPTGFELEYTQPLSEETAAALADAYQVEQWTYSPSPQYGGPKIGTEELSVTAATLSEDGTTVTLEIDGLKRNRVVHVRSPRPFTSAAGEELWNTEAWYTLNELPGDQPAPTFYEAEEGQLDGGAGIATNHAGFSGDGFVDGMNQLHAGTTFAVDVDEAGSYDLGIRYANGPNPFQGDKTLSLLVNGEHVRQSVLPTTLEWGIWATHRERVELEAGRNLIEIEVGEDDTGHVNLDALSVRPAGERVTLLGEDGDLSEWQHTDGREPQWPEVEDGVIEVCCGDLRTKEAFGDFRLHVEFWLPEYPPDVTGQDRANSGVYLQERYEIQVLDSFGIDPPQTNDAAAIYQQKAPDVNAATPPETWQTYDILYQAARYDQTGEKIQNARVTVDWNGTRVHDDVEILGGTGGNLPEGPATGAIRLQDHGNPVRYRNIWIEPVYNAPPELTASAEPTSGLAPLTVDFSAAASDPEGTDVTYRWDFDDPGAPTPTTPETSHTFTEPGTYDVRVTATDADGHSSTRTLTIQVTPDCSGERTVSDEFDGSRLDLCRWTQILREDRDHYRLADGHLEIDALEGDMHGGATNAANVILQDAPEAETWQVVTKVALPEGEEYEQAGLLVHQDDQNFVKLMMMDDPGKGWVAEFGQTIDGQAIHDGNQDHSEPLPEGINSGGIWLRISSDGEGLTAAWSADGETWTAFGRTRTLEPMPSPRVGVGAYNGEGQTATFDFFRLVGEEEPEPDDETAPVVAAEVAGDGSESVTVTLSADDGDGSGVDTVEWRPAGSDEWSVYDGPLTFDEPGEHTIEYRATDVAGNVSEPSTVTFTVAAPAACPDPDDRDTVIIDGVDTGVPNRAAEDGCTINDLLDADGPWSSRAELVRHVNDVARQLYADGLIDGRERGLLTRAAATSGVGGTRR